MLDFLILCIAICIVAKCISNMYRKNKESGK